MSPATFWLRLKPLSNKEKGLERGKYRIAFNRHSKFQKFYLPEVATFTSSTAPNFPIFLGTC